MQSTVIEEDSAMNTQLPSILCVDDDPSVLELLTDFLTIQGFDVLTASNDVEAFLQAKQWKPRVVIMDLFMPQLGGLGALARMKALQPDISVILMSGMDTALDLVTEAGLTVTAALTKPLNLSQLLEVLELAGMPAPVAFASSGGAKPKSSVHARVLVVDDEIEMRKLLAEHCRSRGCEVLEAADGEEALARVPEYRPHIVLLDLMMAGIGGMETLRRIKTISPDSCVIIVTAIEQIETARQAMELGASDYVTKPFSFQELDAVLESHALITRSTPAAR
jgi:DNA-binding response OmpR family regulator